MAPADWSYAARPLLARNGSLLLVSYRACLAAKRETHRDGLLQTCTEAATRQRTATCLPWGGSALAPDAKLRCLALGAATQALWKAYLRPAKGCGVSCFAKRCNERVRLSDHGESAPWSRARTGFAKRFRRNGAESTLSPSVSNLALACVPSCLGVVLGTAGSTSSRELPLVSWGPALTSVHRGAFEARLEHMLAVL